MTASPTDPLIGRVIDGKYQLLEKIGSGGMGNAYKALHVSLGAPRAIKVMRRELASNKGLVDRFQREARLAESLRHPHLVALHDFGQLPDGSWYIVSEFVEGSTVASLLDTGVRFAPDEVARLVGQLSDGLAAAHRKGIIHRDISPDNIMVAHDEAGHALAKLLDFGIAKDVGGQAARLTGGSVLLGKAGYASPEQLGLLAKGQELDGRSDVFSLAAVSHEMLAGALPWRKDSLQSYLHDVLVRPEVETQSSIRSLAPPAWRSVLLRALARQREARTPTMLVFKAETREAARSLAAETPTLRPSRLGVLGVDKAGVSSLRLGRGIAAAAGVLALGSLVVVISQMGGGPVERLARSPETAAPLQATAPATPEPSRSAPGSPDIRAASSDPAPTAAVAPPQSLAASDRTASASTPSPKVARRTPATTRPAPTLPSPNQAEAGEAPAALPADVETAERKPSPTFGSLSVTSNVWCEVSVDDGPAQETPFQVQRLPAGRHRVRAWRAGYKEVDLAVEIHDGEDERLVVALER